MMVDIVVYTRETPPCIYCTNTKMILQNKKIPFKEIVVGRDMTVEELKTLFPSAKTYPVITINEAYIGGMDALSRTIDLIEAQVHGTPTQQQLNG